MRSYSLLSTHTLLLLSKISTVRTTSPTAAMLTRCLPRCLARCLARRLCSVNAYLRNGCCAEVFTLSLSAAARVLAVLRDGRKLIGTVRCFDQYGASRFVAPKLESVCVLRIDVSRLQRMSCWKTLASEKFSATSFAMERSLIPLHTVAPSHAIC